MLFPRLAVFIALFSFGVSPIIAGCTLAALNMPALPTVTAQRDVIATKWTLERPREVDPPDRGYYQLKGPSLGLLEVIQGSTKKKKKKKKKSNKVNNYCVDGDVEPEAPGSETMYKWLHIAIRWRMFILVGGVGGVGCYSESACDRVKPVVFLRRLCSLV
ncbi:hypothetical protein DFP72DRAFT_851865 [Ephemerocybe angulata]|uniref:Secreted protein n=1 Tax=Ephemerocybe angulata TaxID=980116 RepID=A0A8H6HQR0_9AGAR|nr:hypothetical protein DFP72DRAFT_851865 [Tulosesus angulatus]